MLDPSRNDSLIENNQTPNAIDDDKGGPMDIEAPNELNDLNELNELENFENG